MMKGIPPELHAAVIAKAKGNRPPLSIRWVTLELWRMWVENLNINNPGGNEVAAPEPLPKRKYTRKAKAKATAAEIPPATPAETPELGDVF